MNGIYRKKAIKNAYSTEQLDKAIVISSPLSWLGIIGVLVFITAVITWSVFTTIPTVVNTKGVYTEKADLLAVNSDCSGIIQKYFIHSGSIVKKGDVIAEVKTNTGELRKLKSSYDGTISSVLLNDNDVVYSSDELIRITPEDIPENCVVCYLPLSQAEYIKEGMSVTLYPNLNYSVNDAHLNGEIKYIAKYPADEKNTSLILGKNSGLKRMLLKDEAVIEAVCKINNKHDKDKYITNDNKRIILKNKSVLSLRIVTENTPPINKLFSFSENRGGDNE